jgi:Domain of unknown function (DUF4440)
MKNRTWILGAWILFASISLSAEQEIGGLGASGPAPDLADKMMLFGQFVGDWECDVVLRLPNGSKVNGSCDWHFGWTLEGRAIQDVWIAHYRDAGSDNRARAYGTTVRWYDPKADVWQIVWINAQQNSAHTFRARQIGAEIVLDGTDTPHPYRWIFSEITPQSFHWRSEDSSDGGKTWTIGQEMSVRRVQKAREQRDPERDQQAIRKLEQDWLDGEGDRATLERILADDFTHPVAVGVFLNKQEHIDWSVKHPRPKDRKARFETLNVRLFGDTAIATGIVENTDPSGGDKQRGIFTDVFAFREGHWRAVNAQENAIAPMR